MRLAWFRASPLPPPGTLDEIAPIVEQLRRRHAIEIITSANADDFVWQQHHAPVDLCVYELENAPAAAFMWAYLFRYPGLLITSGAWPGIAIRIVAAIT